jgi:tRNA dimethylallyltransferase
VASDGALMASQDESPVIVIGGPTASGKSGLALAIARQFDGAVINADSMQLYDALPILTAQPSAADRAAAPHLLYGVLPPEQVGSAQLWRDMALRAIGETQQRGLLPIVVGGTGFYLRTLMQGLSAMPDIPHEVRTRVRALWEERGPQAVRERLQQRDPAIAARLKPGDKQRQLRALEVVEATDRPLSDWQQAAAQGAPAGLRFIRFALQPEREALRQAIATRLQAMVEAGALEEVKALLDRQLPPDRPILRALGMPELAAHSRGEMPLNQALSAAVTATRQYAKRQDTWFRHQFVADYATKSQFSEKMLPEIFSFIRQSGLTPPA